jgi:Methylase involved in ubiquinone/menaquinone biosynthesis
MSKSHGICPWQAGSMLTGSLRKAVHNPHQIIKPYLSVGMTAMDVGCGMGFFSIPMASIVGSSGKVIAVDLQREMLQGLLKYISKEHIQNITTHQCRNNSLAIEKWDGAVDFAVLFWMLHEVPDKERLIKELYDALIPNGRLLFVEPNFHVSAKNFSASLSIMESLGFTPVEKPKIAISRSALLQK